MSKLEENKRKSEEILMEEPVRKKVKKTLFPEELISPKMKIKNQIKVLQEEKKRTNSVKKLKTKKESG
jgi:hypothetical protein